jgi:hypothetical protein
LGYNLLPDVRDESMLMLQTVPSEDPSIPLLVFYDSGSSTAVLSDRAHYSLNLIVVSKEPTAVDVAGGKTIMIPYGDERLHLQVEEGNRVKATIIGLRMAYVTTPFPLMKLAEARQDACSHAKRVQPGLCLPTVDAEVRGLAARLTFCWALSMYSIFRGWFFHYLVASRYKELSSSWTARTRRFLGVPTRHGTT